MAYGSALVDTIQSSTAGMAPQFNDGNGTQIGTLCRAWVNFNGSTVAIRSSFNVSSVTHVGTGSYTVNFTNNLPNANYAVSIMSSISSSASNGAASNLLESTTPTVSNFNWNNYKTGTGVYDPLYASVIVFY